MAVYKSMLNMWRYYDRSKWYLNFDGVMTYGELDDVVSLEIGDTVEVDILDIGLASWARIISGDTEWFLQYNPNTGCCWFDDDKCEIYFDGIQATVGVTEYPTEYTTVKAVMLVDGRDMSIIGKKPGGENYFNGIIANLKVTRADGTVILDAPLDKYDLDEQYGVTLYNVDSSDWVEKRGDYLLGEELYFPDGERVLSFYTSGDSSLTTVSDDYQTITISTDATTSDGWTVTGLVDSYSTLLVTVDSMTNGNLFTWLDGWSGGESISKEAGTFMLEDKDVIRFLHDGDKVDDALVSGISIREVIGTLS